MATILNPIFKAGCIYEVCIPKTAHETVNGYFDNEQDLNAAVMDYDGKVKGILEGPLLCTLRRSA